MKIIPLTPVLASLLPLAVALCQVSPSSNDPPTVTIEGGVVQGLSTTIPGGLHKVTKYLGVPFAAKPVRFAPPASPKAWSTPLNATKYAPACIQQFVYPGHDLDIEWFNTPPPPAGESEDCLNLNIYAPADGKNRTVMVWFYGGSLASGANSLAAYDGSYFAALQDVIIVTVNYRTNVFGFPGTPELPANATNLGFLDQRFALDWVQRNIAAFGGDPAKVTIFGQSAGSESVDVLVTSFAKNAPFRAAIKELGQSTFLNPLPDPYAAWPSGDFDQQLDNYTLVANRTAARLSGKIAQVPVLAGTNANEGTVFTYGATNLTAYLTSILPTEPSSYLDHIASAYPIGSPGIANVSQQIATIATEATYQCTQARQLRDTKKAGIPTWRYFYNATIPQLSLFPGAGVYHAAELRLVFGTYRMVSKQSPFEEKLSNYIMGAWASFAKNPMRGPGWPQLPMMAELGANGVMHRTIPASTIDARCSLFDPVYDLLEK